MVTVHVASTHYVLLPFSLFSPTYFYILLHFLVSMIEPTIESVRVFGALTQ